MEVLYAQDEVCVYRTEPYLSQLNTPFNHNNDLFRALWSGAQRYECRILPVLWYRPT
jgi:hypothetical protein